MNSEPAANTVAAAELGNIMLRARRIENRLRALTPETAGSIHTLTEALASRLSEPLQRHLHYIGAVRNQAAHVESFDVAAVDLARFEAACDDAERELNVQFPPPDEPEIPDVAVEREFFDRWRDRFVIMAYFPVLGAFNFIRIFCKALTENGLLLLLLLFGVGAVPLVIQGVREKLDHMWMTGAAVFAADYLGAMLHALYREPPERRGRCVWIPGGHLLYLAAAWGKRAAWGKFFIALAGGGALTLAIYWTIEKQYNPALYALGAEWLLSIAGALIWRKK